MRRLGPLLLLGACATEPERPALTALDLSGAIAGRSDVFSRRSDREQAPGEVPPQVIYDTVLLVERAPQTCFDVTLNTEASYDQSFTSLSPRCQVDGSERTPTIEGERHNTASYEYERPAGLLEKTQHVFPSVIRIARLCCPEPASSNASLTLTNRLFGDHDDRPWVLHVHFELPPPSSEGER